MSYVCYIPTVKVNFSVLWLGESASRECQQIWLFPQQQRATVRIIDWWFQNRKLIELWRPSFGSTHFKVHSFWHAIVAKRVFIFKLLRPINNIFSEIKIITNQECHQKTATILQKTMCEKRSVLCEFWLKSLTVGSSILLFILFFDSNCRRTKCSLTYVVIYQLLVYNKTLIDWDLGKAVCFVVPRFQCFPWLCLGKH